MHTGEHRSPAFARWGERLWRRPHLYGAAATLVLVLLALPVLGLKTGMPSIKVVPHDDSRTSGTSRFSRHSAPAVPARSSSSAHAPTSRPRPRSRPATPASVESCRPSRSDGLALSQAIATSDPSDPAVGETIERLRDTLPASVYVGGAVAENHDLEAALAAKTPLVIGVVLVLGFLLLLVALQAPLIAALGVATNLLATGAAFGIGRLIFQDGRWTGLLGYESQGFLDAWAPVFFFAMIFAISMDYTVFLLASAKEHYDRTGDPREAAIGGLALRPRHLRRSSRDGGRLLHLRPLGAAAPEGDGRHPRHRRPARRDADPAGADPDLAARVRPPRLGAPTLARPHPPQRQLRTRLGPGAGR